MFLSPIATEMGVRALANRIFTICRYSLLVLGAAGIVSSCGGGGGGSDESAFLSGTVAVGAPLVGVYVQAACVNGNAESLPTDSNGFYTIVKTMELPCTLTVVDPATGYAFKAMAKAPGIVNVTPLTDLVHRLAEGVFDKESEATTKAKSILRDFGITLVDDPTTTRFSPNEQGMDAAILKFAAVVAAMSSDPRKPYDGIGTAVERSKDKSCIAAQRAHKSADAPCPRLKAEQRIRELVTDPAAVEFYNAVMDEIGGAVWPTLRFGANRSLENGLDVAESVTPYLLAEVISRMDVRILRHVMQQQGGTVAAGLLRQKMLDAMRPSLSLYSGFEALVSVAANGVLNWFLDQRLQVVTASYEAGDPWLATTALSTSFGVQAFALEASLNTVIDCFFHRDLCAYASYANIVTTSFSWMAKDINAVAEAWSLTNEMNRNEVRISAESELNDQLVELRQPSRLGLVAWAKGGMPAGQESILAGHFADAIADINRWINRGVDSAICKSRIYLVPDNFCSGTLEPAQVGLMRDRQIIRIVRIELMYASKMNICRQLKTNEGEVGVSKCLNLLYDDNAAPLTCSADSILRAGACQAATLPGELNVANGNRYELITCGSWTQCDVAARGAGGNLVTIRSEAENSWLISTFGAAAISQLGFWIGQTSSSGSWSWTNGESAAYTNWDVGEPNDVGDRYAHMYARQSGSVPAGKWNNTTVTGRTGAQITQAIVEYRAAP